MTVPQITFPVPYDQIPAEAKRLRVFLQGLDAERKIAVTMLEMVTRGCDHKNAKRGYNERDGSWMNACPHCGCSE